MCSDYKNRRKIVPKQDLKHCEWSDVKGKRYEVGNEIRHNLKFLKVWECWYDNDSKIWKESKIQKDALRSHANEEMFFRSGSKVLQF